MRWASGLEDDVHLLQLIRALPEDIVKEQVVLHKEHKSKPAVVVVSDASRKVVVGDASRHNVRMIVAKAFHMYCLQNNFNVNKLPYTLTQTFIKDHIDWWNTCFF